MMKFYTTSIKYIIEVKFSINSLVKASVASTDLILAQDSVTSSLTPLKVTKKSKILFVVLSILLVGAVSVNGTAHSAATNSVSEAVSDLNPAMGATSTATLSAVAPIQSHIAPIQSRTALARLRIAPIQARIVPVCLRIAPMQARIAPVQSHIAPMRAHIALVHARTAPMLAHIAPVRHRIAPVQSGIAAVQTCIAPVSDHTASMLSSTIGVWILISRMPTRASPVSPVINRVLCGTATITSFLALTEGMILK